MTIEQISDAAKQLKKKYDETEPERLAEVKGISEKKAREIASQVTEKADMRKAMMFLQKYGISLNLGAKIYQKYGQSVYSVLQETHTDWLMTSAALDLKLQMPLLPV